LVGRWLVAELLCRAVPATMLVVAVDPGKASNRVWLTSGSVGLSGGRCRCRYCARVLRPWPGRSGQRGRRPAADLGGGHRRAHRAWVAELERRWPGSVRLFAPSETQAARAQLGSRRYKTDDRDRAALTWLLRQGAGRPAAHGSVDALLGAVHHRRAPARAGRRPQGAPAAAPPPAPGAVPGPVGPTRPRPRPGGGGSDRPGRAGVRGRLPGRPPTVRSLRARAPGRLTSRPPSSGSTAGGGCCPTS
jgi:hypothetical protein